MTDALLLELKALLRKHDAYLAADGGVVLVVRHGKVVTRGSGVLGPDDIKATNGSCTNRRV